MGKKSASRCKNQVPVERARSSFPDNLLGKRSSNDRRLVVDTRLPGYVWVIKNFLSSVDCQQWVRYVEGCGELEHLKHRGTRYLASRECFRMQRQDTAMASTLFDRIRDCCTEILNDCGHTDSSRAVGCNPNLRVYKYVKGHSFGKHVDESNDVAGMGHTKLTVLIYVSSCEGGATRFDPPPSSFRERDVSFVPEAGAMLLHLHGQDCLLHQADPVRSGTKYVLRTDIVYSKA